MYNGQVAINVIGFPDATAERAESVLAVMTIDAAFMLTKPALAMVGIPAGFLHFTVAFASGYIYQSQCYRLSNEFSFRSPFSHLCVTYIRALPLKDYRLFTALACLALC
jgi:hypothetical protein